MSRQAKLKMISKVEYLALLIKGMTACLMKLDTED